MSSGDGPLYVPYTNTLDGVVSSAQPRSLPKSSHTVVGGVGAGGGGGRGKGGTGDTGGKGGG